MGDEIGTLETGKKADLILLDLRRPQMRPLYNIISHLVYAVGRGDVTTTIINGQLVMHDRQLLTIDVDAVMTEVQ